MRWLVVPYGQPHQAAQCCESCLDSSQRARWSLPLRGFWMAALSGAAGVSAAAGGGDPGITGTMTSGLAAGAPGQMGSGGGSVELEEPEPWWLSLEATWLAKW